MSKKIFAYIGIAIGCVLLFLVGSALIMFLAPGVEIFGIRYVAVGEGKYELPKDKQVMPSFTGDIYIETVEVPTSVSFAYISNVKVEYKQEFIGFTRTKRRDSYIEYEVKDNNLHVITYDLETFVYSQKGALLDMSYLKLYLPQTLSNRNIFVKSKNSNIQINANGSSVNKSYNFETNGLISVTGELIANSVAFTTRQAFTLDNNIKSSNITIKGSSNDIKINQTGVENLNVELGAGNLYISNVKNLIFKSKTGSIKTKNSQDIIVEKIDAETYSGTIHIDKITGMETSTIKNTSGRIKLGTCNNISIESPRGSINIDSLKVGDISAGLGVVKISEVINSIELTGKSGYVYLGQDEKIINNPKVQITTGKIFVKNAMGSVDLKSSSNDVDLDAKSTSTVDIISGGSVFAKNIAGNINIDANGEVNISLEKLSGNVNINTKDKCKKVSVNMDSISRYNFNYDLSSSKSRNVYIYEGEELFNEPSSSAKSDPMIPSYYLVKVTTTYGEIYLYTKTQAS